MSTSKKGPRAMAVVGFAEEQPRIPVRLLKLEGLLTEAGGRTMLLTAGVDVVAVSMDRSSDLIAWKDEDEFHQELVDHPINYLRHHDGGLPRGVPGRWIVLRGPPFGGPRRR